MYDFSHIRNLYQIEEDIGFPKEEVQSLIDKFDTLPRVLVEYYLQLGKHELLNQIQDFLLSPNQIRDTGEYIIFYTENQGNNDWAISKKDLTLDNPPVYNSFDYKNRIFFHENDKLSNFLHYKAYLNATQDDWKDDFLKEFLTIDSNQIEVLQEEYPIVLEYSQIYDVHWIHYNHMSEHNEYSSVERALCKFLSKYDDEIIFIDEEYHGKCEVTYSTKNQKHLLEFQEYIKK